MDYEEFTLRVDSLDLVSIRIFRNHDPCVSLGKDSKKVHWLSGFHYEIKGSPL